MSVFFRIAGHDHKLELDPGYHKADQLVTVHLIITIMINIP